MKFNVPVNATDIVVLIIIALVFVVGVRVLISFFRDPKKKAAPAAKPVNRLIRSGSRIALSIDGMQCGMCESHIKDAIRQAVPSASKITASHVKGEASFVIPDEIPSGDLETALHGSIDPLGYRLNYVTAK